jgi:hypothetical protein
VVFNNNIKRLKRFYPFACLTSYQPVMEIAGTEMQTEVCGTIQSTIWK